MRCRHCGYPAEKKGMCKECRVGRKKAIQDREHALVRNLERLFPGLMDGEEDVDGAELISFLSHRLQDLKRLSDS